MNDEVKKALEEIENQLYGINSRNISLRWIGLRKTPTLKEISELNRLLGFIILEIRTLRDTGKMDKAALHRKEFPELYGEKALRKWDAEYKSKKMSC